jgi:hypothetical protein
MIAAAEAHFAGNWKWLLPSPAEAIVFIEQWQSRAGILGWRSHLPRLKEWTCHFCSV